MEKSKPTSSRIARGVGVAAVVLISGLLLWAFGRQIGIALRVRAEENRLKKAVAAEQARYEQLLAELHYVQTDEYVEYWARTEARMAKPGEVVVVPPDDDPFDRDLAPTPEPESEPFWVTLWRLLFPEPDP